MFLLEYILFFSLLLSMLIPALIFSKKRFSWMFLGIGAILQLVIIFANQEIYVSAGIGPEMLIYWGIYLLLVGGSAAILVFSQKNADKEKTNDTKPVPKSTKKIDIATSTTGLAVCPNCGANITTDKHICHVCGRKL